MSPEVYNEQLWLLVSSEGRCEVFWRFLGIGWEVKHLQRSTSPVTITPWIIMIWKSENHQRHNLNTLFDFPVTIQINVAQICTEDIHTLETNVDKGDTKSQSNNINLQPAFTPWREEMLTLYCMILQFGKKYFIHFSFGASGVPHDIYQLQNMGLVPQANSVEWGY